MTNASVSPPGSDRLTHEHGDRFIRQFGATLHAAERHGVGSVLGSRALDELDRCTKQLIDLNGNIALRIDDEFVSVNETRFRIGLHNYTHLSHVINVFHRARIATVEIDIGGDRRQWEDFIVVLRTGGHVTAEDGEVVGELEHPSTGNGVTSIRVNLARPGESVTDDAQVRRAMAKRTYLHSLQVFKNLVENVRSGQRANVVSVQRTIQQLVDHVLTNETALVGLTTLRHHDDYIFTHSVNVCIISLAIGKRLGLTKNQLYELGMAALLHDIGEMRLPHAPPGATESLNEGDWTALKSHPWLGVLTLFELGGTTELPYHAMLVAHEHHMKTDLSGFPPSPRTKRQSPYAKLVAVADIYEAATNRHHREQEANTPDVVMRDMVEHTTQLGVDPVFVTALVNTLGFYPVGTCVILDTCEVAVVHAPNPDPARLDRPTVRMVINAKGERLVAGPLVDLCAEEAPGTYARSISKAVDPTPYLITPSDVFV